MTSVHEKLTNEMGLINRGFFVVEPADIDHIEGGRHLLGTRAAGGRHKSGSSARILIPVFWKQMDKRELETPWPRLPIEVAVRR